MSEDLENNLVNNISDLVNSETQNGFLETKLGQAINCAVDVGLKTILPDLIEDEIIEIKDTFISQGFTEGINKSIDTAINLGKNVIGIATGDFKNLSQVQNAIEKGGIIDGVSNVIDFVLDKTNKIGFLSDGVKNIIEGGKNILLNNISSNIKKEFKLEENSIQNLSKYSDNWKKSFQKEDFKSMEKEYSKMEKELKKIVPLEEMILKARVIENLHTLIKNNGGNFNLSDEQIALSELLK